MQRHKSGVGTLMRHVPETLITCAADIPLLHEAATSSCYHSMKTLFARVFSCLFSLFNNFLFCLLSVSMLCFSRSVNCFIRLNSV
jgi:hypothetical protein